jgi:hypothetical protein
LPDLEKAFPKLAAAGYDPTSPKTGRPPKPGAYNCIAWAANDTRIWWWPNSLDTYWPPWCKQPEETVACFVTTFKWLGYRLCNHARPEKGYEKVALYAIHKSGNPMLIPSDWRDFTDWIPTHMARQLPDGAWTSKCGGEEDITHFTLDALEKYGSIYNYGSDVLYMKRHILIARCMRFVQRIFWKFEQVS